VSYEEAEKLRQKALKKAKELLEKIDKEYVFS
jgi:outer membrane protein assembly factor BamD (BamD/ComL family)